MHAGVAGIVTELKKTKRALKGFRDGQPIFITWRGFLSDDNRPRGSFVFATICHLML
jgi:hypothetical protein